MTKRRHQRRKPSPPFGRDVALAKSTTVLAMKGEDPFAPVEIDYFKRAEQLYAASFDSWEDFDPESR
jgi:hypothetical protein